MLFVNRKTLEPVTLAELRLELRNVSFPPSGPDDEALFKFGYARVSQNPPPSTTDEEIAERGPIKKIGDIYRTTWLIRKKTKEELEAEQLRNISETKAEIAATDDDMPRITEDLIDLLISKKIIEMDDFPSETVQKLSKRKEKRNHLNNP